MFTMSILIMESGRTEISPRSPEIVLIFLKLLYNISDSQYYIIKRLYKISFHPPKEIYLKLQVLKFVHIHFNSLSHSTVSNLFIIYLHNLICNMLRLCHNNT